MTPTHDPRLVGVSPAFLAAFVLALLLGAPVVIAQVPGGGDGPESAPDEPRPPTGEAPPTPLDLPTEPESGDPGPDVVTPPPNAGPAQPVEESSGASWPVTVGFVVGTILLTALALVLTAFAVWYGREDRG